MPMLVLVVTLYFKYRDEYFVCCRIFHGSSGGRICDGSGNSDLCSDLYSYFMEKTDDYTSGKRQLRLTG